MKFFQRFRVVSFPFVGLGILLLLWLARPSPPPIPAPPVTTAIGFPLPPPPLLNQGKRPEHHSVYFLDGKPYHLHPDMLRIDTFTYSSLPFLIHYAWWSHPCETHITSDLNKSAEWNSVAAFEYFKRFIRKNSVVIDIGAHQGDTTVHMAPWASMTIAFEANPSTFVALQTNADINRQHNIHAHNAAIWDGLERKAEWCYTCNGGADSADGNCFVVRYVDDLEGWVESLYGHWVVNSVSFIKIDTEGRDFAILGRLHGFVKRTRPHILLEWFVAHTDSDARWKMHEAIQELPRKYNVFDSVSGRQINVLRDHRVPDLVLVAE